MLIASLENKPQEDDKLIPLSAAQTQRLENIKNLFPSYEKEGLGKTHLLEYKIELEPELEFASSETTLFPDISSD